MQLDPDRLADLILDAIGREVDPLRDVIKGLEARAAIAGPPGERGEKGMDGARGPSGPQGVPGQKGDRGDVGPSGPQGVPGQKGDRGDGGPEGPQGAPGAIGAVGPVGPTGPPGPPGVGEKGLQGLPGRDGRDGQIGEKGLDGQPGAKGLDGTHGRDGKDGLDGVGFDDLDVVHDGARGFTFRFTKAGRVKEFPFRLPVVLYRGVWENGKAYERGDQVTAHGSTWTAMADTAAVPGDGATAWVLSAKRGRDGKQGLQGEKGLDGRPGRDLTQMDETGRKW